MERAPSATAPSRRLGLDRPALAGLRRDGVLVLGAGPEVERLAGSLRTTDESWFVVIGEPGLPVRRRLERAARTRVVEPSKVKRRLAELVRGAAEIYVIGTSDDEAWSLASAVVRSGREPDRVLFDSHQLARLWNEERPGGEAAVARGELVAGQVLLRTPATVEGVVTPPPIVIGEGAIAEAVLRGIVQGWQQPGERFEVHCLGPERMWVDAGLLDLRSRAYARWVEVSVSAATIGEEVDRLTGLWRTELADEPHATTGPTIVVSFGSDATTAVVAEHLAGRNPEARVAAVLTGGEADWASVAARHTNLTFLGALDLVTDRDCLQRDRRTALVDEIVAELGRWPSDVPGLLPVARPVGGEPASITDQREDVQRAIRGLAAAVEPILAAGGLHLTGDDRPDAPPVVANPAELGALAERVAAAVAGSGADRAAGSDEWRLRLLEFAARLPTLAARAGYRPHRELGTSDDLTAGELRNLAQRIHLGYGATSSRLGNATGSPNADRTWEDLATLERHSNLAQAYDAPVKVAMAGLSWRRVAAPRIREFSEAEVERLAELEHRRWYHFELRNGRPLHRMTKEWSALTHEQKEYDRDPVRALPGWLAAFGLELVDPAGTDGEPR